jgi:enterochelin esterase-like enzyme
MRCLYLFLALFLVHTSQAQSFAALLDSVNASDASQHAQLVSDFLASTTVPHFEDDTTVVFLWTGSATAVNIAGDFNNWSPNGYSFLRLAGTNLWYAVTHFESDARLDYKLVIGSSWNLDPRNPRRVPGGFGANSELAMPQYVDPWEIEHDPGVSDGSLNVTSFASTIMGNSRRVQVYTPAGYDPGRSEPYPVILYHDGSDYVNLASIQNTLDNLIAAGRIEPIVAVFANPVDREAEYATGNTAKFTRLVVEDLMPWVEANYHVSTDPAKRAVTGPSYAGLASARHCFEHPEEFGLCAPFSPSFWVSQQALLTTLSQSDLTGIKWYVDWGTYEPSIATTGRLLADALSQQGATFKASEWHEGHSWGSWRAHQDTMLEYFFPGVNATSRTSPETPPHSLGLSVYPNPSSGPITIAFDTTSAGPVQVAVFDLLGRRVETLLDSTVPPGAHRTTWDPETKASGSYLVRIKTAEHSTTRLLTLVP